MSQPPQKKKGGMFRALVWAVVLAALAGVMLYLVGLGIASLLSYSGAGQLIAGQLLNQFGYTNASKAITGIATGDIYQASVLPYVLTLLGAAIGAGIGYFKGKREDEEEG